jgi:hypothetical protein
MAETKPWSTTAAKLALVGVILPFAELLVQSLIKIAYCIAATGQPCWAELLDWPNWVASLVIAAIGFIAYLGWALSHLRFIPGFRADLAEIPAKLKSDLAAISKELTAVRQSGFEAVRSATKLIDRTLHTSLANIKLWETHPREYHLALEALGFNFTNWFEPINNNLSSPELVSTWLSYIRTYYLEEAFDVKHREVVTNARNFTYLLLATLQSFSEHCGRNSSEEMPLKAIHLAVTPVHPKDWFNWPHGFGEHHGYFEQEFMGQFRRCLREVVGAHASSLFLESRRYILAAADDPARDESKTTFSWHLDPLGRMQEDLKDSWILPIAVPVTLMNEVSSSLMHYYDHVVKADGISRDGVPVVPLICKRWTVKDSATSVALKSLIKELGDTPDKFLPLVVHARSKYTNEMKSLRDSLQETLGAMRSPGIRDAWAKCESACLALLGGQPSPLYDAILASHVLDVHLSEEDPVVAFAAQENLRKLISKALHLKDCLIVDVSSKRRCSLGEVFAKELHLRPEHSQVLSMTTSAIRRWSDHGLKSEFHIFGVQKGNAPPEWKIVIAADINYPFEVAKVHILDPDAPPREAEGRHIAGFGTYDAVATELYTKNTLFGEEADLLPVWAESAEAVAGSGKK